MSKNSDEHRRLERLVDQLDPNGKPQIHWAFRAARRIKEDGKRLGIFSGSFNPLTVAHIKMIEAARKKYDLDEIFANFGKGKC